MPPTTSLFYLLAFSYLQITSGYHALTIASHTPIQTIIMPPITKMMTCTKCGKKLEADRACLTVEANIGVCAPCRSRVDNKLYQDAKGDLDDSQAGHLLWPDKTCVLCAVAKPSYWFHEESDTGCQACHLAYRPCSACHFYRDFKELDGELMCLECNPRAKCPYCRILVSMSEFENGSIIAGCKMCNVKYYCYKCEQARPYRDFGRGLVHCCNHCHVPSRR